MNKEQILEEQVKALEKLLGMKDEIIKQLEKQLADEKAKPKLTFPSLPQAPEPYNPWKQTPSLPTNPWIIGSTCVHEYEPPSQSSIFQRCKKCGHYNVQAYYSVTNDLQANANRNDLVIIKNVK